MTAEPGSALLASNECVSHQKEWVGLGSWVASNSPENLSAAVEVLPCSMPVAMLLQGAFSVAAKRKVPVVPITLQGTGELMPVGAEGRLFSGTIKVCPALLGA